MVPAARLQLDVNALAGDLPNFRPMISDLLNLRASQCLVTCKKGLVQLMGFRSPRPTVIYPALRKTLALVAYAGAAYAGAV